VCTYACVCVCVLGRTPILNVFQFDVIFPLLTCKFCDLTVEKFCLLCHSIHSLCCVHDARRPTQNQNNCEKCQTKFKQYFNLSKIVSQQ
jgi:hypothetical protein